jgi:phosphoribosyl 1,2-cyclic phosphodiesterase
LTVSSLQEKTIDGIFLTHAHIGHYTGLMFLGREVMNANAVNVYGMDGHGRLSQEQWSLELAGTTSKYSFNPIEKRFDHSPQ